MEGCSLNNVGVGGDFCQLFINTVKFRFKKEQTMLCVATGTNVTLRLNKVLFLYLLNVCDSRLLITAPC